MKVLAVISERCTACRLCELACSFVKTNTFDPIKSRIKINILMEEHFYMPMTCMQCKSAPCAAVCPTSCIELDRDKGFYYVDHKRCIGCRMCVMACPFGVIEMGSDGNIFKCDHCGGDPECVKICPTDALEYFDVETQVVPSQRSFVLNMLRAKEQGVQA